MIRFIAKLFFSAWVLAVGIAAAAKLILQSHGDPATEEIDLIAIFEARELASSAQPFYGGKILAMYGSVRLDLRDATPAPTGVHFDLSVLFGGLELIVPEGWRAVYQGKIILGGFADETRTGSDEDVPFVTVGGYLLMGRVRVTTQSPIETAA